MGMTILLKSIIITFSTINIANAFVQPKNQQTSLKSSSTTLNLSNGWKEQLSKTLATSALITGALFTFNDPSLLPNNMYFQSEIVASAKEMASGSGSRVNKDPDSLLRYGLPINSKDVRKLQKEIETIEQDLRSKRLTPAADGVKQVRKVIEGKDADKIAAVCNDPKACKAILDGMGTELDPLNEYIQAAKDAFTGSEQERKALDKANLIQGKLAKSLTVLEEGMVPKGYKVKVPEAYKDLPQLQGGRAKVEMIITKGNPDEKFLIDGKGYKEAKLVMIVDGYTAPVTSGNFVDLVERGWYTKMNIQRSDGFVVQTGEPAGGSTGGPIGYVPEAGTPVWEKGPKGERTIPLEIFVKDDKAPTYEITIEEDLRGGQATVLPFSSYGALGWARGEYEPNSGSTQFFWLLFDSDLTPGGKNVLDGNYPCFGYVVEGADFLPDIKEGDLIVSAKVVEGLEFMKK